MFCRTSPRQMCGMKCFALFAWKRFRHWLNSVKNKEYSDEERSPFIGPTINSQWMYLSRKRIIKKPAPLRIKCLSNNIFKKDYKCHFLNNQTWFCRRYVLLFDLLLCKVWFWCVPLALLNSCFILVFTWPWWWYKM